MALAINLPDLLYVWMAAATPDNLLLISICVAIEQLGYGFGFTAYMLYLIYIADGEHKTAHYGTWHDASGNAGRMDTGTSRIHQLLYLGMRMHHSRHPCFMDDPQSTGQFLRKKEIKLNYL